MNVITLTGNAVKDVELKYSPAGKAIGNGTIAVRRDFKNQNGEYETDFINFVALGKTGEIMANHIKKGDKFGITGRLQIRKWTKDDGSTQYFTEVIVNGFDFPSKPRNEELGNSEPRRRNEPPATNTRADDDPFANNGQTIDISDDNLPF